jgi:amino acid transporter
MLRASAFVFVVYLGGEAIAVAQAEVKNPGKTIPRAILLTSFALIALYTAITYVVFRVVPAESLAGQSSPLAFVARQFLGEFGVVIITIAGIIAALSSVNTSLMAQSRVAYALARDGYFPKSFFKLHRRFSTPFIAILAGSIFVAAVAATGVVNFVTYATDFGFIIGFVFVNLSLIKLRREKANLARPFKVPFYPLTPILGIITSLLLILFLEPGTLVIGAELFLFSLLAYYIRMVGHYRLRIAVGGMNFAVSAFSALFAYLLMSNSLPVTLSSEISALISAVAILISVFYLGAGILNTMTQNSGE